MNFTEDTLCDILIVGGGGGGGKPYSGGGGGGEVIYFQNKNIPANTYTIKVGKGGSGSTGNNRGSNGEQSEAFLAISSGGGGGGGYSQYNNASGLNGGCGGGAGYNNTTNGIKQLTDNSETDIYSNWGGTNNQYGGDGNDGGTSGGFAGGGGGAGGSSSSLNPDGNDGIQINIDGNNYYWAGGGGGYSESSTDAYHSGNGGKGGGGGGSGIGGDSNDGQGGTGGINIGGPAPDTSSGNGGTGGAHTGGGGGGTQLGYGGNGGSGVVIIRKHTTTYKTIALPYQLNGPNGKCIYYEENADPNNWDEANIFSQNKGGRLPTKQEMFDYLDANGNIGTSEQWIPIYNTDIETPYKDYICINNIGGGTLKELKSAGTLPFSYFDGTNSLNDYYFWVIEQTNYTVDFPEATTCDILIVGGGGGGGGGLATDGTGGGGGAGGLVFLPNQTLCGSYTFKVGKGGEGTNKHGLNGIDSLIEKYDKTGIDGIDNFISKGGGGGGNGTTSGNNYSTRGVSGGSGGGGGGNNQADAGNSIQSSYNGRGFGNIGGYVYNPSGDQSGGGGGAGSKGGDSYVYSGKNAGGEGGIGLHKVNINGNKYIFKDIFGTNFGQYIINGETTHGFGTSQDYFNQYYENPKNYLSPSYINLPSDVLTGPHPKVEEGIYFAGGGAGKIGGEDTNINNNDITYGGLGGGGSTQLSTGIIQAGINGTGGGGGGTGKRDNYTSVGGDIGSDGGSGIIIIRYKSSSTADRCWITHNTVNNNKDISNISGSYLDTPSTTEEVKYTLYWNSILDLNYDIYINRSLELNNYIPKSSLTCSEIWNLGTPYIPQTSYITIDNDKVGIGVPNPSKTLDIDGDIKFTGTLFQGNTEYTSFSQTDFDNRFNTRIGEALSITGASTANTGNTVSANMGIYNSIQAFIDLRSDANNGGWIDFSSNDNLDFKTRIRGHNTPAKLEFYTGSSKITTIDENGNLILSSTGAITTNKSLNLFVYNNNEEGIFFRSGFNVTNKYNCSILIYDHSGDNNHDGISINAYDGISFCVGSGARNEKMRIAQNGYVGIGHTTPDFPLHIQASSGKGIRVDCDDTDVEILRFARSDSYATSHGGALKYLGTGSGNNNKFTITMDNVTGTNVDAITILQDGETTFATHATFNGNIYPSQYIQGIAADLRIHCYYSNAYQNVLIVPHGGNIGIATTSPQAKLQIGNGTSASLRSDVAILSGDSGGASELMALSLVNSRNDALNTACAIGFHLANNWSPTAKISAINTNANGNISTSTDLVFNTYDGTLTEKMRIGADGNVGIATIYPKAKLQIGNGTSTSLSSDVAILSGDSGGASELMALSLVNSRNDALNTACAIGFHLANDWSPTAKISAINTNLNSANGVATDLVFNTHGGTLTEKMRIGANGNVGIGITNPKALLNTHNILTSADTTIRLYNSGNAVYNSESLWLGKGSSNTDNYWGLSLGTIWTGSSYIQSVNTSYDEYYDLLLQPNGGNVGIGNTSPSYKLDVDGVMRLGRNDVIGSHGKLIFAKKSSLSSTRQATIGYNDNYEFCIADGVDTTGAQLKIGYNCPENTIVCNSAHGNVGIGCVPQYKLHVSGDTRIDGHLTVSGTFTQIHTNTTTTENMNITNDGTGPALTVNQLGSQPVINFEHAGTSVLYVKDGGYIGMGTVTPSTSLQIGNTNNYTQDAIITLASDGGNLYKQGIRMIHHGTDDINMYGWFIYGSDKSGTYNDTLRIGSYRGGTTEHTSIVIDRTGFGNIGLGIDTPNAHLTVYDNLLSGWAGMGSFGNSSQRFVCGVYNNVAFFGGHNAAHSSWTDCSLGGNLGIGTILPTSKLHIHNAENNSGITISTDSQKYYLYTSDSNNSGGAGFAIQNQTLNNTPFKIKADGNVLTYKQHIASPTVQNSVVDLLTIEAFFVDGGSGSSIAFKNKINYNPIEEYISARIKSISNHSGDGSVGTENYYSGHLIFETNFGDSSNSNGVSRDTTERMRITNRGNVGIGTINPKSLLHLSSGTSGSTKLILESDTDNNNEYDTSHIVFRQDGGLDISGIHMINNVLTFGNNNSEGGISFRTTNTSNMDYLEAIERLRVTPSGNIGIGTNDPIVPLQVGIGTTTSGFTSRSSVAILSGESTGSETELCALSLINSKLSGAIGTACSLGFNLARGWGPSAKINSICKNDETAAADLIFLTRYASTLSEKMRICDNGNVGIGIIEPAALFHVKSSFSGDGILIGDANALLGMGQNKTDEWCQLIFWGGNQAYYGRVTGTSGSGATIGCGGHNFRVGNPAVNAMKINEVSGVPRVGINTTDPQRTLDLSSSGQITFGDDINADNNQGIYWHNSINYGIYRTSGAWTSGEDWQQLMIKWDTGIILDPGSGIHAKSHVGVVGGMSIGEEYYTTEHDNGLIVEGSVGIGTKTPASGTKLHVKDSRIRIEQTSGNPCLELMNSYNTYIFTDNSNGNIVLRNNANKDFIVDLSGNINIGNITDTYTGSKIKGNVTNNGVLLSSPDVSQFLWTIIHAQKWGIYWSTNSSSTYHFANASNPNEIVFVGADAKKACIDLDNGDIRTIGTIYADGQIYCDNWFRTIGNGGWYSETHAGGWHMNDSAWIRNYNSKSVKIEGNNSEGVLHVHDNSGHGEPIARFTANGNSIVLIENTTSVSDIDEVGIVIKGSSTSGYWLVGTDDSTALEIKYDASDYNFAESSKFFAVATNGNVGIGTNDPQYKLDVDGTLKCGIIDSPTITNLQTLINNSSGSGGSSFTFNTEQFTVDTNDKVSLLFGGGGNSSGGAAIYKGMIVEVKHNDYKKMQMDDPGNWTAIDDDLDTGFVIGITPKSISSSILLDVNCYISFNQTDDDARWWGARLYRKIGDGDWTHVTGAGGDRSGPDVPSTLGTAVWFGDNNLSSDHAEIGNCSARYLDNPNTIETVYYTIYWKCRLGSTDANKDIALNRSISHGDGHRAEPISSWTAQEIWNSGTPYTPTSNNITINNNNDVLITGNLLVTGDITAFYSDERLKDKTEDIKDVLPILDNIDTFKYKNNELANSLGFNNDNQQIGLSAQQIREYYPELIELAPFDTTFDNLNNKKSISGNEYLTIKYDRLVPILLQGIKELNNKNKILEERNKNFENELNIIKEQLKKLV